MTVFHWQISAWGPKDRWAGTYALDLCNRKIGIAFTAHFWLRSAYSWRLAYENDNFCRTLILGRLLMFCFSRTERRKE